MMNKQQGWHALNANLDTEVGNKTVFGAYVQPNGVGIMIINDPMNDRLQFAVFNTDDLDGLSSEECNQKLSDDSYITKVAKKIPETHFVSDKNFPVAIQASHDLIISRLAENVGKFSIGEEHKGIIHTVLHTCGVSSIAIHEINERINFDGLSKSSPSEVARQKTKLILDVCADEISKTAKFDQPDKKSAMDTFNNSSSILGQKIIARLSVPSSIDRIISPELVGTTIPRKHALGGLNLTS